MPASPRLPRLLILAAAVLAALPAPRAHAQTTSPQDSLTAEVEAAVSQEREAQGLTPVQASATLEKVAQTHAEDMVKNGYFAPEGPPGSPTVEALLDQEGYAFTLVTEKLVRGPLDQTVENLAAGWHAAPDANRASLLLDGVREVGAGVAVDGDARIITIVLATPNLAAAAASKQAAAYSALASDPEPARNALVAAIAKQRSAWGLAPLRGEPSLGEAASRHAQEVLAALLENRDIKDIVSLADLVAAQRVSAVEIVGGSEVNRQRKHASRGTNTVGDSVGQVIVKDATTADEAIQTALQQDFSALRDARYLVIAVGLAVHPPESTAESGHSVWVIALATH